MRDYFRIKKDIRNAQVKASSAYKRHDVEKERQALAEVERLKEELKAAATKHVIGIPKKNTKFPFRLFVNDMEFVKKFKPTAYTYVKIDGSFNGFASWRSEIGAQGGSGMRIADGSNKARPAE